MTCKGFFKQNEFAFNYWFFMQLLFAVGFIVGLAMLPGLIDAINADLDACEGNTYKGWIAQEYNVLENKIELVDKYSDITEETFKRWCSDNGGMSLFESWFGAEYTQNVEEALGVDFSNPESFSETGIDQRAQELQDALTRHQVEYNYYPKPEEAQVENTRVRNLRGGWSDANGNSVDAPEPKDKIYNLKAPTDETRLATGLLMGGTIVPAVGLIHGSWKKKYDGAGLNNIRIVLLVLIIIAAIGFGAHGLNGNFEVRNDVFVKLTQYAMYALFGSMCVISLLGAWFTIISFDIDGEAKLEERMANSGTNDVTPDSNRTDDNETIGSSGTSSSSCDSSIWTFPTLHSDDSIITGMIYKNWWPRNKSKQRKKIMKRNAKKRERLAKQQQPVSLRRLLTLTRA